MSNISARARQDLSARAMLFDEECPEVVVPSMSQDRLRFWSWMLSAYGEAQGVSRTLEVSSKEKLHEYRYTGEVVLPFSGGLESTYLAAAFPHVHRISLDYLPNFDGVLEYEVFDYWMESYMEGGVPALLAGLGYSTVIMGNEWRFGLGDLPEANAEFCARWFEYSGQTVIMPLLGMTKDEIAVALARLRPDWYSRIISCIKTKDRREIDCWCGRCAKCQVAWHTAQAIGRPLPFSLRKKGIGDDYWSERYREHLSDTYDYEID